MFGRIMVFRSFRGENGKNWGYSRRCWFEKMLEYFDVRNFNKFKNFWENIRFRGFFSVNVLFIVVNRWNIYRWNIWKIVGRRIC